MKHASPKKEEEEKVFLLFQEDQTKEWTYKRVEFSVHIQRVGRKREREKKTSTRKRIYDS